MTTQCNCKANHAFIGEKAPTVRIICEMNHLTAVPTFRNVSYKMTEPWTIDLQMNNISTIGDYAFSNLKDYANENNVSLKLGVNRLRNISDSAFSGIESLIIYLDLGNNQFQVVPSVVSKLTNLQSLSLLYNPSTYIDPSIFTSIHNSLNKLEMSVVNLPNWPRSLAVLTELDTLVNHTKHNLPQNAFTGFSTRPRCYETFFMLNSAETKIYPAHKC